MAHPGDKGLCLLDGYVECAAIVDQACICEKMPADIARAYYRRKFAKEILDADKQPPEASFDNIDNMLAWLDDENNGPNLVIRGSGMT